MADFSFGQICCGCNRTWRQFVADVVPTRVKTWFDCYYATDPCGSNPACGVCPYIDTVTPLSSGDYLDAMDAAMMVVNSADFAAPPAPGGWSGPAPFFTCPDWRVQYYTVRPGTINPTYDCGHGMSYFWYPDSPLTFDPRDMGVLQSSYDGNHYVDPEAQRTLGPASGTQCTVWGAGGWGPCGGPNITAVRTQISSTDSSYGTVCVSGRQYQSMNFAYEMPDCAGCFSGVAPCGPLTGPTITQVARLLCGDPVSYPLSSGFRYTDGMDILWTEHSCSDCTCP